MRGWEGGMLLGEAQLQPTPQQIFAVSTRTTCFSGRQSPSRQGTRCVATVPIATAHLHLLLGRGRRGLTLRGHWLTNRLAQRLAPSGSDAAGTCKHHSSKTVELCSAPAVKYFWAQVNFLPQGDCRNFAHIKSMELSGENHRRATLAR